MELTRSSTAVIYASPFSRTVETARLCAEAAGLDPASTIHESLAIRERGFGDLEMQSHDLYETVWARDNIDPTERPTGAGGESVTDVSERVGCLLTKVKTTYEGTDTTIVFVTHGDCGQILLATARGTDLRRHRLDNALETGELRRV